MDERYPPPPWHLRGDMYLALWSLPGRLLPSHWHLPHAIRPLFFGRQGLLVTFWADYRPGGTLAYRELLVTLAVHDRWRIAACAVEAWVDNEQSLTGGRSLWEVPKQAGTFTFTFMSEVGAAGTRAYRTGRRGSGLGTVRTRLLPRDPVTGEDPVEPVTGVHQDLLRLPGRLCLKSCLLQPVLRSPLRHQTVEVPLVLSGTARLGRARLTTRPGGPLHYLTGHPPLMALSLRDFRFTIGQDTA